MLATKHRGARKQTSLFFRLARGVASKSFVTYCPERPGEKLVRGAVKGHRYARNNRSGTIPILARTLKIKEDVATRIYDAALPGMVADGSIDEES